MSNWGERRRFGESPYSYAAVPLVESPPFEPIHVDHIIREVVVTHQDRPGLNKSEAMAFIGKPYAAWITGDAA